MKLFSLSILLVSLHPGLASAEISSDASAALSVCTQYQFLDSQQSCIKDLRFAVYDSEAVRVCTQYRFLDRQQECLVNLKNLSIDPAPAKVCEQYQFIDKQESCLKDLGQPVPYVNPAEQQLQSMEIQRRVEIMATCKAKFSTDAQVVACMQALFPMILGGGSSLNPAAISGLSYSPKALGLSGSAGADASSEPNSVGAQ